MIRHSDDVIWSWYCILQRYWESDLNPTEFCRDNKLEINKFIQFRYRIEFFSVKDPGYIKKILEIRKEGYASRMDFTDIALKYNIKRNRLFDAATHVVYVKKIKILAEEKGMTIEPHLQASLDMSKAISEPVVPMPEAKSESPTLSNYGELKGTSYSPYIHPGYEAIEPIPEPEIQEEPQMKFIQVPPPVSKIVEPEPPEIIEKQNDLEIIIAKGVKVSISPNIDSLKIIKIIELLKDL